jgi:serine/threonine protein kinase
MDSYYKIKYNKYKEKYLNLKKLIGSGKEADAYANFVVTKKDSKITSITYHPADKNITLYNKDNTLLENYTWGDYIDSGSYGSVYIIYDSENNKYIIKISNTTFSEGIDARDIIYEGTRTNILKGILDDKSIPKYQGKLINTNDNFEYGYLISEYNGETLQNKKYTGKRSIDDKNLLFIKIVSSIFLSIFELNSKKIYHNDIKLNNIVISEDNTVRLIDFGLLTVDKPENGTQYSMSFKSVINMRFELGDIDHTSIIKINEKLKLTDYFGFFYCCVDLLHLWNNSEGHLSYYILRTLNCVDYEKTSLDNLINLYYFILPDDIQTEVNTGGFFNTTVIDSKLPNAEETIKCFNELITSDIKYINLYRYICYIYKQITKKRNNFVDDIQLKQFLIIISECLKYDLNLDMWFPDKVKELKLFLL